MESADGITEVMLKMGWIGMLLGVLSGALMGLFFHREDWMGGYGSYRRRLARLGHISFFGLGFVNFMFAFTHAVIGIEPGAARVAMVGFLVGAVTMPLFCFLSAWKKPLRHGFPVPVAGVLVGVISMLVGWS